MRRPRVLELEARLQDGGADNSCSSINARESKIAILFASSGVFFVGLERPTAVDKYVSILLFITVPFLGYAGAAFHNSYRMEIQ